MPSRLTTTPPSLVSTLLYEVAIWGLPYHTPQLSKLQLGLAEARQQECRAGQAYACKIFAYLELVFIVDL